MIRGSATMGKMVHRKGTDVQLDALPPSLTASGTTNGTVSLTCINRSIVPQTALVSQVNSNDLQVALVSLLPPPPIYLSACPTGSAAVSTKVNVATWSPKGPGYTTIKAQVDLSTRLSGLAYAPCYPSEKVTVK